MKSPELLLELSAPELADLSGPHHHEDLPGLGQQLQDDIDESRKIVGGRNGGLVLPKRCVAQVSLVDGREQERRVGKELLPVLAREDRGGAGDRHDEVRLRTIGERGYDEVDDRLFRRAHRPCRTHDDLNEVHRVSGPVVQFDMEIRGEVVDNQVAAVERLQHEDLPDRLSGPVRRRPEHQQASQHDACGIGDPRQSHDEVQYESPPSVVLRARIYISRRTMKLLLAAALLLFCVAGSTAAQPMAEVVGSVVDQTSAPLPGVRVTIRGVADRTAETGAAGDFAFPDLPEGDYEISAELSGFERQGRAVRVRAGERATVSFALRVALVEKTIVTAAKAGGRDVQEIPIAITAVSPADLGRLGTQTIEDTRALAPSVTFSQNTGWGQLTIRGIGTNAVFAGSDPSSAIYLDGVYLARPAMVFARFLDLERIEVLRGPQGTLYGRNAVGGAMNLDTPSAHQ